MSWLGTAFRGVSNFMGGGGGQLLGSMASSGNMAMQQGASMWQERQQTMQNIMTMQAQTRADATKQAAQRQQIKMETLNKVNEMQRETAMNRTKSASKIHGQMVKLMQS